MSNVSQGIEFEKTVELLLQVKGYKVTRNNLINGTQIDLLATKADPLNNISLVVECADRKNAIGVDLVKEKAAVLLSLQGEQSIYRLMFVSSCGFTAEAKAFADSQAKLTLLSLSELESLIVDLTPYIQSYLQNYEKSLGMFKDANLYSHYIDLSARDEHRAPIPSLERYVSKWLMNDGNSLLFLLGDYGAGKTSFSRNLVYTMLRAKYRDASPTRFIPILINLRDSRGTFDLRQVVVNTLTSQYGVNLASFSVFERLCSTGKVLIILDGFDEMSDRCDAATITDAFAQIYLFATLDAKVLLTCRSNFFKSHADVIELLRSFSISIPVEGESPPIELSLKEQGTVLYVENLNAHQIKEFVKKRFGSKTDAMLSTINRIHDLSDLSTRPVLLDMIVSTLPELEKAKGKINSAALYSHYTDAWSRRDQWRVSIPLKVRQSFCEVLAWAMHCADASSISHSLLQDIMAKTLSQMADSPDLLEKFRNDIQTCSFLVRSSENDQFRFAHKSFLEYFVARKVVSDLCAGANIKKVESAGLRADAITGNVSDSKSGEQTFEVSGPMPVELDFGSSQSSMLDYFHHALNEKMRSSRVFHGMQEAEMAARWIGISNDAFVRSHLESEIRGVFSKQWLSAFSEEAGISEEIATFAVEHAANLGVSFETLITRVADGNAVDVLCDIVRLAKSPDWVQQNAKSLKTYVLKGKNQHLKIASTAALISQPKLVPMAFLRAVRKSLQPEGWSYVLFELASDSIEYASTLATLYLEDQLAPVDQVICVYGLGGSLPADDNNEKMSTLLIQLLDSTDEREHALAIKVCSSLPSDKRMAVVVQAFKTAGTKEVKKALIRMLEEVADPNSWKLFRALATQEQNPEIRSALLDTEQILRDINSRKRSRDKWDSTRGKQGIRESLWGKKRGSR